MPGDDKSPSACACASECPRFDRKAIPSYLERRYAEIARDIEGFPVDLIAELITNPVGSEKHLAAVGKAIEYATVKKSRFLLSVGDLDIVLDTFRPASFHIEANKGKIHPTGWNRAVMSRAANSECPEFFTEVKQSNTTGLKEIYVAIRVGESRENIVAVIRASKTANPF